MKYSIKDKIKITEPIIPEDNEPFNIPENISLESCFEKSGKIEPWVSGLFYYFNDVKRKSSLNGDDSLWDIMYTIGEDDMYYCAKIFKWLSIYFPYVNKNADDYYDEMDSCMLCWFSDDYYEGMSKLLKEDEDFIVYLFSEFPAANYGFIDFIRSTRKNNDFELFKKCFDSISKNEYTRDSHLITYEDLLSEVIPKKKHARKEKISYPSAFYSYFNQIISLSDNDKVKKKLYKRLEKWNNEFNK
ncbi:hypothetical protein NE604_07260 [Anaerofustis stercorihominis]|uniref:hypothetical protein n=1 Tax=Anaerofustis stercorihominis TaxID=214853 RepID=UPI002109C4B2|nr:hypothetical protein [Anaerofustis stercorihominis]MCQ4795432.1 hypothetical protein [Anaerofustis stercorihominis]